MHWKLGRAKLKLQICSDVPYVACTFVMPKQGVELSFGSGKIGTETARDHKLFCIAFLFQIGP